MLKKLFQIFLPMVLVVACSEQEQSDTQTATELEGSWRSTCTNEGSATYSHRTTITFSFSNISQTYERYSGDNCPSGSALYTVVSSGTFEIGAASSVSGANELNVTYSAIIASPVTSAGATFMNVTSPPCPSKTNWTLSTTSVEGLTCNLFLAGTTTYALPITRYTIYLLSSTGLKFGVNDDLGSSGSTTATRSSSLGTITYTEQ